MATSEYGMECFKKPLAVALVLILVSFSLYNFQTKRKARTAQMLEKSEVVANNAKEYLSLQTAFRRYRGKLPKWTEKDNDEWLSRILSETTNKNRVTISFMDTQETTKHNDFQVVARNVEIDSIDYFTLGKLIADIENYKVGDKDIFLRVVAVNANKAGFDLSKRKVSLKVNMKIATMFYRGAIS